MGLVHLELVFLRRAAGGTYGVAVAAFVTKVGIVDDLVGLVDGNPAQILHHRVANFFFATVVKTLGRVTINQSYQIVNIADFCNECGNCDTFCPTSGAPYKDKFKMHLTHASLAAYGEGFHLAEPGRMQAMFGGQPATLTEADGNIVYEDWEAKIELSADTLEARRVELKNGTAAKELSRAVETAVLYRLVSSRQPFAG